MVITSERGPAPPVPMAAVDAQPGVESGAPQVLQCSSFKIPKAWGAKRLLRFLNVNGKGELVSGAWGPVVVVGSQGAGAPQPRAGAREAKADAEAEGDGTWFKEPQLEGEQRWVGVSKADEVERAEEEEGGFDEVRAKLLVHLHEPADRVQVAIGRKQEGEPEPGGPSLAAAEAPRPWNLRARTAVRKVVRYGYDPEGVEERGGLAKPAGQRSRDAARSSERPRFSVSLSAGEIADDIYALTGSMPRRRPRKRARVVQRQLDALFPGSWLTEITADTYKVAE